MTAVIGPVGTSTGTVTFNSPPQAETTDSSAAASSSASACSGKPAATGAAAAGTTDDEGRRGRSSWIDYDALARVHDYILERAVTVHGSRWLPGEPLHIQDPTYDGARISGVRRPWV